MTFELSPKLDRNKVFLINSSMLEGRLDAIFYHPKYINNEQAIKNSGWDYQKVNHLVERIVDGPFGSDLKVEEYLSEGYPLLRVSNIRMGEIEGSFVYISEDKHEQLKRSKVYPGDVLLTKAGAILGYSAVFPKAMGEGNITSHLVTITCKNEINPYYLSCFFRSNIGQLQIYRWGNKSTRPELNTSEVKNILVTVPPLHIQAKVVDSFNIALSVKKQREQQANKLLASIDDYLLSELGIPAQQQEEDNSLEKRIFIRKYSDVAGGRVDPYFYRNIYIKLIESLSESDYDLVSLSGLSSIINGYDARNFIEEGTMYLRVSNIRKDDFLLDDVKFIPITEIKKDIQLNLGDILLTRKGSYGVSVVVDDRVLSAIISSEIFLLRLNDKEKVNANYISAYFNSIIGQVLFDRIKTGAIMGHVSQDALRGFGVLLPPLEKQREIVAHIAEIRQQAKQLREEAAQELEQAKMEVERMILGHSEV